MTARNGRTEMQSVVQSGAKHMFSASGGVLMAERERERERVGGSFQIRTLLKTLRWRLRNSVDAFDPWPRRVVVTTWQLYWWQSERCGRG